MKIIITESQFKRLIENIISESDSRRKEFIDILNKEKYPYKIKNNKIIINGSYIDSNLITYIPDNVEFNNNGFVWLDSLNKMGNNIIFNNNGDVYLESIFYFNINSVKFTNNVTNVLFGKETYWMDLFPYELYNIRGNFYMTNKEGNYEIMK